MAVGEWPAARVRPRHIGNINKRETLDGRLWHGPRYQPRLVNRNCSSMIFGDQQRPVISHSSQHISNHVERRMNEYFPIFAPVIGIVGVVAGVLLNEFMRRRNRRELYAPKIFEKRLAAYEGLIEQIHQGSRVAEKVIESEDLTAEQRHALISVVVHEMAEFTEKNILYLDEDLTVHCMALFMGVEDIHDASEQDRQELLDHYRQMRKEALRMAAEDSGVAEVNRLFKAINNPKIDGELIRYFRKAKRKGARAPSK